MGCRSYTYTRSSRFICRKKGVGVAAKASKGIDFARYTTGTAGRIGKIGEQLAGIVKNTRTIKINNRSRIPDGLNRLEGILSEVKNVKKLYFTSQLKDYMQYSKMNGYRMELYIRPTTYLTRPFKKTIEYYGVKIKYLW